jgi:4-hydroxy-tetrahydrodipicolinate synthase
MSAIGRHVSKLTEYAPALPTPFRAEGDIDISAFEQFCDLQLAHGATALILCGATGEAPTLTPEEHRLLIQIAADRTRGRIPVIAGAGANATAHAIELARDRRSSWGGCYFVSRAMLQQADAGRALRSLSGDRGIDRTADHSL